MIYPEITSRIINRFHINTRDNSAKYTKRNRIKNINKDIFKNLIINYVLTICFKIAHLIAFLNYSIKLNNLLNKNKLLLDHNIDKYLLDGGLKIY